MGWWESYDFLPTCLSSDQGPASCGSHQGLPRYCFSSSKTPCSSVQFSSYCIRKHYPLSISSSSWVSLFALHCCHLAHPRLFSPTTGTNLFVASSWRMKVNHINLKQIFRPSLPLKSYPSFKAPLTSYLFLDYPNWLCAVWFLHPCGFGLFYHASHHMLTPM